MNAIPKNKKVLHLTVTRNWFDKIASGEKKEDFRQFKSYWIKRLLLNCEGMKLTQDEAELFAFDWSEFSIAHLLGYIAKREFDYVLIRAGYGHNKPTIIARFSNIRITDYDEETDLGTGRFFAIGIGEIIKRKNL